MAVKLFRLSTGKASVEYVEGVYGAKEITYNVYYFDMKPNKAYDVFVVAQWASCREWTSFKCIIPQVTVVGETGIPIVVASSFTDISALISWLADIFLPLVVQILESAGLGKIADKLKSLVATNYDSLASILKRVIDILMSADETWKYCVDKVLLANVAVPDTVLKNYTGLAKDYMRACGTLLCTSCFSGVQRLWTLFRVECDDKTCRVTTTDGKKYDVGKRLAIIVPSAEIECQDEKYMLKSYVEIREAPSWAPPIPPDLEAALIGAGLAGFLTYWRDKSFENVPPMMVIGGVVGYLVYKGWQTVKDRLGNLAGLLGVLRTLL